MIRRQHDEHIAEVKIRKKGRKRSFSCLVRFLAYWFRGSSDSTINKLKSISFKGIVLYFVESVSVALLGRDRLLEPLFVDLVSCVEDRLLE